MSDEHERKGNGAAGVDPLGETALVLDGAVVESNSAPAEDRLVGATLDGKYQIRRKIGNGGMADVYEATQVSLGSRVAVKVMQAEIAADQTTRQRFLQEARLIANLNHPNIVKVLDVVEMTDGRVAIVMEFLDGTDLRGIVGEPPTQQPIQWSVWVVLEAARAMIAAHQSGVIHRDLKPENIFLANYSGGTRVVVMDFGVALLLDTSPETKRATRLTMAGGAVGTARYVSPEQADGQDVDGRTDVYALAGVLYEMLAGVPAFPGDSIISVLKAKAELKRPVTMLGLRSALPAELDALVLRSLDRDPDQRPATMREFAAELEIIFRRLPEDPPMAVEDTDVPVVSGAVPLATAGSSRVIPGVGVSSRGVARAKTPRSRWMAVALVAITVVATTLIIAGVEVFLSGNEKSLPLAVQPTTAPAAVDSAPKVDAGRSADSARDGGKTNVGSKLRKRSKAKHRVAPPAPATSGNPAELQAK